MAERQFGPERGFGEGLFEGGGEGLRALVEEVVQAVIGSEADQHFGAPWNAKGLPRPNGYRNGLKERDLRTRVGTLRLRLPQARNGSFYPSCLERWQTSEQALAATLGEMVIKGVSTRKVSQLAEEMLGVEVSASTVSNLVKAIEPKVEAFRERPLGTYRYLIVDARFDKVRDEHRVTSRAFLWAAGVTPEGQREVLGWLDWASETGRAWREFFRLLKERGLTGVELVVSDAHEGLVRAIEESFPGAMWQECQTHFMRRALDQVRDATRGQFVRTSGWCSRPAVGSGQTRRRLCWSGTGVRNTRSCWPTRRSTWTASWPCSTFPWATESGFERRTMSNA